MMSRSNLRTILILAITTVVILVGVWLVQAPWKSATDDADSLDVTEIEVDHSGLPAPVVGQPAADFTATALSGDTVKLSDLRGQPVWLVFGATWCTNCRAEAPDVESVAKDFDGKATVVSIYVGESRTTVQGYADRLGLTNPQIPDTSESLSSTYAIMGIPAHFFIDSSGTLQKISVGTLTPGAATDILNGLD